MSNQVKTRPRADATQSGGANRTVLWIVLGVVLVVVVAAIVAVVATAGSDDDSATPEGVSQTQPVDVQGASLPPFTDSGPDSALGAAAPTIAGSSFDGEPVRISPGAPTLVFGLAHWCPHCQREVPVLVEWGASGQVPEGLEVIGLSTGVDSGAPNYPPSEWLVGEGWSWPVLADDGQGSAAQALGLTSYPYWVLLDEDGRVLDRGSGQMPADQLSSRLDAALAGA